ncbi:hypothetical protein Btru_016121 [Bulinus truncatus]|nr:hypothetical protein Btru_016121 [Bulinus truncatus]
MVNRVIAVPMVNRVIAVPMVNRVIAVRKYNRVIALHKYNIQSNSCTQKQNGQCRFKAQPPLNISVNIAAIRLSNPQSNQTNSGLVEVQLNDGGSVWGSICGRNRTVLEVNIICQMMGYQQGQQTFKGSFGVGSKNFLLENMTCPSNATSLDNCTHYFLKTCSSQDDELYVVCQPTPSGGGSPLKYFFTPSVQPGYPSLQIPQPALSSQIWGPVCQSNNSAIRVRIFSGDGNDTYGMGYVQLQVNGTWVYICQNNWNRAAAKVACREMCFSSLDLAQKFTPQPGIVRNYVPDPTNPTIAISEVICSGSENSIFDCNYTASAGLCLQSAQPTLAGIQCLPQNNTKIPVPHPEVACDNGVLSAIFYTSTFPYITQYNIDVIPAVPAACVNKTYNSTLFQISVDDSSSCGTILNDNGTHLTYENTIRYAWLNNNLKSYQYVNERYHLVCTIPKTNVVTNRYQPFTLSPLTNLYGQSDFALNNSLRQLNKHGLGICGLGICSLGICGLGICGLGVCGLGACGLGICGLGVCGLGICGLGICGLGVCGLGVCGLGICNLGICGLGVCGLGICGLGVCGLGICGLGICGLGVCGLGVCGLGICGLGFCGLGFCGLGICVLGICALGVCGLGICGLGICGLGICGLKICGLDICGLGICG